MGVPRLFKYIKYSYPDAITYFYEGEFSTSVDYLYIDANCLLHQVAQLVYNYGQQERRINVYDSLTDEEKVKKVYELFFQSIVKITHIISPKKVLYIAIDGPAPLSKQAQQRQRRFVSARNRNISFDSNCLTPGTLFMHKLTRYMHYAIRNEINSFSSWKRLKVYFSPATVPSEGEHKCLDFIRGLPENERKKSSHCLFGPDGDLIMLTLATHIKNMYLFREDQYNPKHYYYLDMGLIRDDIHRSQTRRSADDAVNDFIVEGFFVGNDFLPKIKMFYLLEDGLEMMLSTYKKISNHPLTSTKYLTTNNRLSLDGFKIFVQKLSLYETDLLEEQAGVKITDQIFRDDTLLKHIKETLSYDSIRRDLDFEGYRCSYYSKAIKKDFTPEDIEKMCHDYLKSFIWVLEYYVSGLPSWTWAYCWHYPPLLNDFYRYLKGLSHEDFERISTFDMGEASKPIVQLLSVLPPSSSELLPKEYRRLMRPSSSLSKLDYYIEDFSIDYEGKAKKYQGIALLPFVDHNVVKQAYHNIKSSRSRTRNELGSISLFQYRPSIKGLSFVSDMGTISNLQVTKRLIPPHRK